MTTDRIPTTEQVRSKYATVLDDTQGWRHSDEWGADFDRWLAQARAETLREAADAWTQGAWANTPRRSDRVADRMAAAQFVGDWLRERAAEIARNAGSQP